MLSESSSLSELPGTDVLGATYWTDKESDKDFWQSIYRTDRAQNPCRRVEAILKDRPISYVTWNLAIIENLIRGEDGLDRAAHIRTSTGYTN